MSVAANPNQAQELRRLIPLNELPASRFEQVCAELEVEDAAPGAVLFRQGDTAGEFVYVLSGTVSLQAGGVEMDSISGGTEAARFALAQQNPRKVSAIARDRVRYVRVAPDLFAPREDRSGTHGYKVSDLSEASGSDWMSSLLRSPIFQRLPPVNLQAILRGLEEIRVKAGEVICRQDDPGDYFYIIKSGQCSLSRKPTPTAREVKLATLRSCETFGEDTLISEKPRTLTVTMDTDGQLLRLDKASFLKLVRDPVISRLSAQEAIEMVNRGGIWLDVRLPDHYEHGYPFGSTIQAPFFSLRMLLPTLDRNRQYVTVCEDGKVSEAAAYLLLRYRFNAHVLRGGMATLSPEQRAVEPNLFIPEAGAKPERGGGVAEPEAGSWGILHPEVEAAAPGFGEDGSADSGVRFSLRNEVEPQPPESRPDRMGEAPEPSAAELRAAQQAVARLGTELAALRREHEELLQERSRENEASGQREAAGESLKREIEDLQARYAEAVSGQESALREVDRLERQLDGFKAMVEQFLEQRAATGEGGAGIPLSASPEGREPPASEAAALQAELSEARAEADRLKAELRAARVRSSVHDQSGSGAGFRGPAPLSGILWPFAVGLLLTTLILGALFGLPQGRDLVRFWLSAG